MIEPSNIVDIPFMADATRINRKTLSALANGRALFPSITEARIGYGKVYDWSVVRPVLVEYVGSHPEISSSDPAEWPT